MHRIGITTTMPIEIVLAGGCIPIDLNNLFISQDCMRLVHEAEIQGFPRNFCSWIKGIYSITLQEKISHIIAVTQGDCSNTQALMETLSLEGVTTIPFAYPYDRDQELLKLQMERLLRAFQCTWREAFAVKDKLDKIRNKVHIIDRLTWEEGLVTGFENHYFQISCSDMQTNPKHFEHCIDKFLQEISTRNPVGGY